MSLAACFPGGGVGRKGGERCCLPSFPGHELHSGGEGPLPGNILPPVSTGSHPWLVLFGLRLKMWFYVQHDFKDK